MAATPAKMHPMIPTPMRVAHTVQHGVDTVSLEMDVPQGCQNPFKPGQFNMLYAFGIGEIPISISGNPACTDTQIHTVRTVGAVSGALAAAQPGTYVGVRGPFGTAWPLDAAKGGDVLVLAGGIGIAALRALLFAIASERSAYGSVTLLYGTRTPDSIIFGTDMRRFASNAHIETLTTVDCGDAAWRGHVGFVTDLIKLASFNPQRTTAFVCGPEIMMRFAVRSLTGAGVDDRKIHLSLERNMKCAIRQCGRCQLGPVFVCRDGPVFPAPRVWSLLNRREA